MLNTREEMNMNNETENREKVKLGAFAESEYCISVGKITREFSKLDTEPIKKVADVFYENLKIVNYLILFPYYICANLQLEELWKKKVIQAKVECHIPDLTKTNASEMGTFKEKLKEVMSRAVPGEDEEIMKKADRVVHDLFVSDIEHKRDLLSPGYFDASLPSAIMIMWCAIEVLTKDLWVVAANSGNQYVTKNLLSGISKSNEERRSTKIISLDQLGKYDFNIQNKLGTILVNVKRKPTHCAGLKTTHLFKAKPEL